MASKCAIRIPWLDVYKQEFNGAEVSDRAFRALAGFPVDVVDGLWHKYGQGKMLSKTLEIEPCHWLWFLSFLHSSMTWMELSQHWRVKEASFRRVVKTIIDDLHQTVDEVRVGNSSITIQIFSIIL